MVKFESGPPASLTNIDLTALESATVANSQLVIELRREADSRNGRAQQNGMDGRDWARREKSGEVSMHCTGSAGEGPAVAVRLACAELRPHQSTAYNRLNLLVRRAFGCPLGCSIVTAGARKV